MPTPNFFILGAPKCGTTALHEYLGRHPQIFMTSLKEPHHYSTDLPAYEGFFDRDEYLRLFSRATLQQRVRGEGSVYYAYSQVAIPRILAEEPQARFVMMVRNPLDMVCSLHAQHVFKLTEDVEDFEQAWRLQEERQAGRSLPVTCPEPMLLQYRELGRLGKRLQFVNSLVAPEQLHTIVFDDFVTDTPATYRNVLKFLQVADDGRAHFPRANPNTSIRWHWLQGLLNHRRIPTAWRAFGRRCGLHHVHRTMLRLNGRVAPRQPQSPALRHELAETFRDDVKLLSSLLQRDLSHWTAVG